MELKQRKKLNNLPKFDAGNNPEQSPVSSPLYFRFPGLSSDMPSYTWLDNPVKQTAIGNLSDINTDELKQAVTGTSGFGSYEDVFGGAGSNQEVKIGATAGQKISSVVGGVANLAQGFIGQQNLVKGTGEMMANAGTQERSIGGVGYTRQNYIDESAEKSAINKGGLSSTIGGVASGASAGAAFGPWGAVVGGVVGGITGLLGWGSSKHKLRKRLENARQMTTRINTGNQAGAMTTALQQDYYSKYGNTQGGVLYANRGKDIMI